MRGDSEEGSSLILVIFAGLLGLVVVLGVAAMTSLYIERKRLFTLADGAAIASAESFALSNVQVLDGLTTVQLRDQEVLATTQNYLRQIPLGTAGEVKIISAHTPDGVSASVTLLKVWRPPVLSVLLPAGVPLEVTALARTVFG